MTKQTLKEKINRHCNTNGHDCNAYAENRCYGRYCTAWSRKVIKVID
jgi:hypothetical protein